MAIDVSVILPTRGRSPQWREALASALANGADLEVLIVHDRRPGDAPLADAPLDAPRTRVVESARSGPAAARNAGLAEARGRFAAFLDDDDLWDAGHLAAAREVLARWPGAALVATDAYVLEASAGPAPPADWTGLPRFQPRRPEGPVELRTLLLANPVLTPTVVLDRERAGAETRFDESLPVMEDYELWLRLAQRSALVFDPRPSVLVRRRSDSASQDWRRMAEGGLEIFRRLEAGGVLRQKLSSGETRRRLGGLWHDLAYACLREDDPAGARGAAAQAARRQPSRIKNYVYWVVSFAPRALRSRLFGNSYR